MKRALGYYKVNYFGKWYVLEYVCAGTKQRPIYYWTGTIEGVVLTFDESLLGIIVGDKIEL